MAGVIPLPVGRASSLLVQQRLIAQLQSDQQEIVRLTAQLSTGRRVLAPSDDASAASRGVTLQKILEQKEQSQVNLNTSRSYLAASETAVARVTDLLIEIRGAAVRAADTTTSDQERLAISEQIEAALGQLLGAGNQQFRDRYLFAGTTTTVQPYEVQNGAVVYRGNEGVLESYADVDQLYSASVNGSAVLGGLSAEVRGSAVLTPALSENVKLADLHGGAGVELGSIVISDGVASSTIDLTGAKTLGDVIRRIEAQPPQNRTVTAQLGPTGLNVSLDTVGGGAHDSRSRRRSDGRTARHPGA
jgi:flagellar hook-associated protein 3 FlgL